MRNRSILFILMLGYCLTVVAQVTPLPRTGEERMNRSNQAAFWADPQFLTPSVFMSERNLALHMNRKWWRENQEAPAIDYSSSLRRKTTNDGRQVLVEPIVEGTMGLYREKVGEEFDDRGFQIPSNASFRYWIGSAVVTEVNSANYKSAVRMYMPEAKDLHKRLGKAGFRFENLPSMVIYYNRFFGKAPILFEQIEGNNLILQL